MAKIIVREVLFNIKFVSNYVHELYNELFDLSSEAVKAEKDNTIFATEYKSVTKTGTIKEISNWLKKSKPEMNRISIEAIARKKKAKRY